jgi:diacylglycerol kinase (ATP)
MAFVYSYQGFKACFKSEAAFRQELALVAIATPVALLVEVSNAERALLLISLGIILIVELLNSAIEACIDRIGEGYHPLSGEAKDIGSAAVLSSFVIAISCWGIILI